MALLTLLPVAHLAAAACAAGHCKTVEFTFDMCEDTAECIANEMMEDLSLSADEAAYIADKIKEEISRMGSEFIDSLALGQHSASQHGDAYAAGQGSEQQQHSGNALPAGTVSLDGSVSASGELDPAVREAVVANAAAAAVTAFATAAAAANSSSGGAGSGAGSFSSQQPSQQQSTQQQASQQPNARSKSGYASPRDSGRPPSYHDLARAMREFHEQQLAAEAAARAQAAAAAVASDVSPAAAAIAPHIGHILDPQALVTALESPPLEVRLPNGHALDPAVLAKVAATAATAAASALNEVMPARHGQQHSPVCTVSSFTDYREEAA